MPLARRPAQPFPFNLKSELLELARKHDHTRTIKHFLFHKKFPVDIRHNAKIGREKLTQFANGKLP